MRNTAKRIMTIVLTACLLMVATFGTYADTHVPDEGFRYNNVSAATATMSINSSGLMTINYKVNGYPNITTQIVIKTYIEKSFLGLFWVRVNNGQPNNEWVDTINNYSYNGNRTFQLSSTGTYRTTVKYTVYGTGGSPDEIEKKITATY